MTWARLRRRMATALVIARLLPAYLAFAIIKHLMPLRMLARLAWRDPKRGRDEEADRRLVARVVKTRGLFPLWDRDCLQKSLLLYRELSHAGADPVLVVGFRRTGDGVMGHAWVVANGNALADRTEIIAQFAPALRFGRRGELLTEPAI